jgi:hypothetical protein
LQEEHLRRAFSPLALGVDGCPCPDALTAGLLEMLALSGMEDAEGKAAGPAATTVAKCFLRVCSRGSATGS